MSISRRARSRGSILGASTGKGRRFAAVHERGMRLLAEALRGASPWPVKSPERRSDGRRPALHSFASAGAGQIGVTAAWRRLPRSLRAGATADLPGERQVVKRHVGQAGNDIAATLDQRRIARRGAVEEDGGQVPDACRAMAASAPLAPPCRRRVPTAERPVQPRWIALRSALNAPPPTSSRMTAGIGSAGSVVAGNLPARSIWAPPTAKRCRLRRRARHPAGAPLSRKASAASGMQNRRNMRCRRRRALEARKQRSERMENDKNRTNSESRLISRRWTLCKHGTNQVHKHAGITHCPASLTTKG